MTQYKIIIDGLETGLTPEAVEYMAQDAFPNAASVQVLESKSAEN